jgi:hypothetical protein
MHMKRKWGAPGAATSLILTLLVAAPASAHGPRDASPSPGLASAPPFAVTTTADSVNIDPDEDPAEVIEVEVSGPASPEPEPGGSPARQAAKICTFIQRVDYVHISSTSKERAAQSHGNWDNVDCTYTLADVTTQIDRRNPVLLYEAVGKQGKGRLAPNTKGLTSGGAGRVTAHYTCNAKAKADFRSWTSIDIVGYADVPNKVYSPANPLSCG